METNNEIIEDIDEVVNPNYWPPTPQPKCVAQVGATAKTVDVKRPGNCCVDIIASAPQISIVMKEIKASIIKGKVVCGSGSAGVEGAIVVATNAGNRYVGVTNSNGEYSICVKAPTGSTPLTYSVEAYCCSSCVGEVCSSADCNCGCK